MKRFLFLVGWVTLVFTPTIAIGENTGSVYGVVIDKSTKKPLVGVNVTVTGTTLGGSTNLSGYYKITNILPGSHKIVVSMIGYKSVTLDVTIYPDKVTELNVSLETEAIFVPEVVVSGERLAERSAVSDHAIEGGAMLIREGQMQDPIRVIQTLPGIASKGDLFSPSQIYVRGGGPDENLFLLDWTEVHWPWHFGGMKSVFNSEVIDKIELQTGGFSAKYGDCLSSVFNITTREGNRERFSGNASLGFINTQALLEGPITPKGFYLLSSRRTYLDLVMGETTEFPVPYFWDANLKLGYEPWHGQRLYLSGLISYERIDFYNPKAEPGMPKKIYDDGKLNTQSLEWKSLISDNLYSVTALTREYNDWQVEIGKTFKMDLNAEAFGFVEDLTWKFGPLHEIKTGVRANYSLFNLVQTSLLDYTDPNVDPNDTTLPMTKFEVKDTSWSLAYYLQNSYELSPSFSLTGGLRLDYWNGNKNIDISPRLSFKYELDNKTALRGAWGIYTQNPEAELPKNPNLESKKAIHYILGISRRLNDEWATWLELYEKKYRDLVTVDTRENYTNDGTGYARGVELFLEKKAGPVTGWLSYSVGLAKRRELLDQKEYYADFDQRHMVSAVLDWNFWKGFTLVLQARYASGRPYTPIIRADTMYGQWIPVRGETNSERFPPFHQLNIRLQYKFGLKTSSYVEVWNLYNRKNTMGYVYNYGKEYPNNVKQIAYYSTPFLISGGFRIEF